MKIERTKDEIVIRLPAKVSVDHLQRLINYLSYQEVTADSQAQQDSIDELAREVNQGWWEINKQRFSDQ